MSEEIKKATGTEEANENENTVLQIIEDAAEGIEDEEVVNPNSHDWSTETTTFRTILKRLNKGTLKAPLCQRLYVWSKEMRESFLETIERNYPSGAIIVAESDKDNTNYLIDGLQRLTTCAYLSQDKDDIGLTEEQKKKVLDYRFTLITVKDMSDAEIKDLFNRLNSGIVLASITKARASLTENLNNCVLEISSNEFFKTLNKEDKIQTTATFVKSGHNEIIAMNVLIAAAGIEQETNKAKELAKTINDYETDIQDNFEKSKELIKRIANIYNDLDKSIAKRALNANFTSTLAYILANTEYRDDQIEDMINYIFAKARAISEYSATTRSGAGDVNKCRARYNLMLKLLENPPTKSFNEEEYRAWCKDKTGKFITDQTDTYRVDFSAIDDQTRRSLYIATRDGNRNRFNSIVKRMYEQLEERKDE